MMIGDELEMRYKGTEAFPSGKRFRMDHNADKFSVRCDERVDLFRESLEIRSLKRAFGGNEKNTTVSQQFKSDHLSTHSLSSGSQAPWTTARRAKTGRFDGTFLDPRSLTIPLECDYSQLREAANRHFSDVPERRPEQPAAIAVPMRVLQNHAANGSHLSKR